MRCDERECQYVDLNEAPCLLRVEMFGDGSAHRVAEYLSEHAGTRFCYACLTHTLGLSHDQVRRASWQFLNDATFSVRPSRCPECRRRRVTIGFAPGGSVVLERATSAPLDVPASELAERLSAHLRARPGFWLCVHCLVHELGANAGLMRDAMWTLENQEAFSVRTAECVSCLLTKRVMRHEPPSEALHAAARVLEFLREGGDLAFCAACVAFACDVALPDATHILGQVDASREFEPVTAACSACGRWQTVFRRR